MLKILCDSSYIFENGGILIWDDVDGMELSIMELIISLFEQESVNKAEGQLLLTTHDPILFEKDLINARNAFIFEGDKFINIKESRVVKRTEDMLMCLKSKNYFNDLFWESRNNAGKATLNNIELIRIIHAFEDDV